MVERIFGGFEHGRAALCQIRASKPIKTGRSILVNGYKVLCIGREKEFYLLEFPLNVGEFLESFGEIPIPPYLGRDQSSIDQSRYQTVYGKHPGAVAAPTAGLHITEELLEEIKEKGVKVAEIINDNIESGYHSINWNGSNHASGVYIVQIQANGFNDTQKIMLLK